MALIAPDAKYYVKMLKNVLVKGRGRLVGDVVEVDLETQRRLVAMNMAVEHTPALGKIKDVLEKTSEKLKGK